jgi:bacterioferritin (cytochrome b1)
MPYKCQFTDILLRILPSEELHCKWLNTLSCLENSGARKIAEAHHPTLVRKEMIRHAAEEFRHALHLKRQIEKLSHQKYDCYSFSHILGGWDTLHYLPRLNLQTYRFLVHQGIPNEERQKIAYLLVTYAIELRAGELYPLYEALLRKAHSKVTVKSILLEEEHHLEEMKEQLALIPSGFAYAKAIIAEESELCQKWLSRIVKELG